MFNLELRRSQMKEFGAAVRMVVLAVVVGVAGAVAAQQD